MFSALTTFAKVHVLISLIAIFAGFVATFGLQLKGQQNVFVLIDRREDSHV